MFIDWKIRQHLLKLPAETSSIPDLTSRRGCKMQTRRVMKCEQNISKLQNSNRHYSKVKVSSKCAHIPNKCMHLQDKWEHFQFSFYKFASLNVSKRYWYIKKKKFHDTKKTLLKMNTWRIRSPYPHSILLSIVNHSFLTGHHSSSHPILGICRRSLYTDAASLKSILFLFEWEALMSKLTGWRLDVAKRCPPSFSFNRRQEKRVQRNGVEIGREREEELVCPPFFLSSLHPPSFPPSVWLHFSPFWLQREKVQGQRGTGSEMHLVRCRSLGKRLECWQLRMFVCFSIQ